MRQKLFGILHDEDALYVEFYARLVIGLIQIQRRLRRNVKNGGVLEASFGLGMEPEQRIFPNRR